MPELVNYYGLDHFSRQRVLYHVVSGSRAYGLDVDDSDLDTTAFCFLEPSVAFGLNLPLSADDCHVWTGCARFKAHAGEQLPFGYLKEPVYPFAHEHKVYDLRTAFQLLLKGSPQMMELLWVPAQVGDSKLVQFMDEFGRRLRDERHIFFGRKSFFDSTVGQARNELNKLRSFKPYTEASSRCGLVKQHNFDPKGAANLLRWCRMGTHALRTGEFVVYRDSDRLELRELRLAEGKWSQFDAVDQVLTKAMSDLESAYLESQLRDFGDREAADRLLTELVLSYHASHFYRK